MNVKELLYALAGGVCDLYALFVFVRVLSGWFRYDIQARFAAIINFTAKITDPALNLMRRIFPFNLGRVDISPISLLFVVMLIKRGLFYLIEGFVK